MTPPDYQASLLPPTSTDHTRRIDRAAALTDALWAAAARVGDLKREAPAEAAPFLIWELGLEEVAPWIADPARLIAEGRAWQKIRGTPASIAQALSWADAPLAAIEEHPGAHYWDLFQLALTRPAPPQELARIAALCRLSKPAHLELARVYSGFDKRTLRISGTSAAHGINSGARINDWSGIWLETPGGRVKASFGEIDAARADLSPSPAATRGATVEISARRATRSAALGFRINRDALDGARRMGARRSWSAEIETDAGTANFRADAAGWADGPWPLGGWDQMATPRWTARGATLEIVATEETSAERADWRGGWPEGDWPDDPWPRGLRFISRGATIETPQP